MLYWQVYTLSKLHRLFRMINYMMEDSVRLVVTDCLTSYCKYIELACSQQYVGRGSRPVKCQSGDGTTSALDCVPRFSGIRRLG